MAAAATVLALMGELPTALTMREFERWFQSRPAVERADLRWVGPALKKVLDALLGDPLTREAIDEATSEFIRIVLSRRRFLARLARGDVPPSVALEVVRDRRTKLSTSFGADVYVHIELAARFVHRFSDVIAERIGDGQIELPALDLDVDELIEAALASPAISLTHVSLFLAAVLECADRDGPAERGRELARLAVVAAAEGTVALRAFDVEAGLDADESAEGRLDRALAAMAELVLCDPQDPTGAVWWVRGRMPQRPLAFAPTPSQVEAPRFRKRLMRCTGSLHGVSFGPEGTVTLRSEAGHYQFRAKPELVERALELRGSSLEAIAVFDASQPLLMWGIGAPLQLVRIGPASEEVPDPETRTRDILRDWDELLHRLAQ